MMPRFASQAEYYRHHRAVFALALELGITPAAAEAHLRDRQRRARREEFARSTPRAAAKPDSSQPATQSFLDWDAQHMMRN